MPAKTDAKTIPLKKKPQNPLDEPCGRCGNVSWVRTARTNVLLSGVLDFFHLYPWRCAVCRRPRFLKLRSDRRIHR